MIKAGYYTNKQDKLVKKFKKLLKQYKAQLSVQYGEALTEKIIADAMSLYVELIPRIPFYKTPLYWPILLLNSQLVAIIRAMKKHGKPVEDVVKIQAKFFKEEYSRVPSIMGRFYVSKFVGKFMSKMARQGTAEGWEAEFVRGTAKDDFDVSVVTRKCGLVEYLESEGMAALINYCNFSGLIMFPAMNIGLRQPSTIVQGKCVYCMKYRGKSEIPASLSEFVAG